MGSAPLPHLPLLRAGRPHRSLAVETLSDVRSGAPVAEVSQALPAMIARDLEQAPRLQRALAERSVAELVDLGRRAARVLAEAELPLTDEVGQTPADYLRQLAATTGLPEALGRANLGKIVGVLARMEEVLDGLTRGVDLAALDGGWGDDGGRRLAYLRQSDALGLVLPNNSPGVHTLWLPALPLKVPVFAKPGRAEPWTPYRVAQAWRAAGGPPEALNLYPTGHDGAAALLLGAGRSLLFGDAATVAGWQSREKVQLHGPGWSKVLFGEDRAAAWRDHLELLVESVAANGGRSCINASGIWTPGHGRELAAALAERLATSEARALDDPAASLAAFPDPEVARRVSAAIDRGLELPGAEDVTARYRPAGRVATVDGCTFLLPTVVFCDDPGHPLARAEYLFPFVAVVEVGVERMLDELGPTLVATVLTDDPELRRRLLDHRAIDRLNLGPVPTYQLAWDQPHEGNLFHHLYQRRALQIAPQAGPALAAAVP